MNTQAPKLNYLVAKEIKTDKDGKGYISQRGLARLCGVNQNAVRDYFNLGEQENEKTLLETTGNAEEKSEFILDIKAAEYLSKQALKGNKKAILSVCQFAAVGIRVMIQMETGYQAKQADQLKITTDELLEARKKLAFGGMHEDSPKVAFEIEDNSKVNKLKESWRELGYLDKKIVLVQKAIYSVTTQGEDFLYRENNHIRIKKDACRGLKLITQAFNVGRYGQSDLFVS